MTVIFTIFSRIKRCLSNISADFTLFIYFTPNGTKFAMVNELKKIINCEYFDPYIPFLLSFYTFFTYYIIILRILSYFGSHLDCQFETRANLDWLTRNFQIIHSNEYLDKVSCLYPDVHDFLHSPLHKRVLFPETPWESEGFMYPCTCMLVSVYYVILQTSYSTHLYLSRRSTRLTVHIAV